MKYVIICACIIVCITAVTGFFYPPFYIVKQYEQAIEVLDGNEYKVIQTPGLHFKNPLTVEQVIKEDLRMQTLSASNYHFRDIQNKEAKVNLMLLWKIADIERYYKTAPANRTRVESLLSGFLRASVLEYFRQYSIEDIANKASINRDLFRFFADEYKAQLLLWGIEPYDLRVMKIDMLKDVKASTYHSMINYAKSVAAEFRIKGRYRVAKIQASNEQRIKEIQENKEGKYILDCAKLE